MLWPAIPGLSSSTWSAAWSGADQSVPTPSIAALSVDQLQLSPAPLDFEASVDLSSYQALAILIVYTATPVEFRVWADVGNGSVEQFASIFVSAAGEVSKEGEAIEFDPYPGNVETYLDLASVVSGPLRFTHSGVARLSIWTD